MKNSLILKLQKQLPNIAFKEAATFYWSPETSTIHMNSASLENPEGQWALLHEAAHALLGHEGYQTDAGLLMLEVEAWQAAQKMSQDLGVNIDEEHIQDCLDTYRDWVYARSTCPTCALNSLQMMKPRTYASIVLAAGQCPGHASAGRIVCKTGTKKHRLK